MNSIEGLLVYHDFEYFLETKDLVKGNVRFFFMGESWYFQNDKTRDRIKLPGLTTENLKTLLEILGIEK